MEGELHFKLKKVFELGKSLGKRIEENDNDKTESNVEAIDIENDVLIAAFEEEFKKLFVDMETYIHARIKRTVWN